MNSCYECFLIWVGLSVCVCVCVVYEECGWRRCSEIGLFNRESLRLAQLDGTSAYWSDFPAPTFSMELNELHHMSIHLFLPDETV